MRRGERPIVPIFDTIIIDTMLKKNGVKKGHRLKHVTCEQAFSVNFPICVGQFTLIITIAITDESDFFLLKT